ncbi:MULTISPECIES: phosphoenolpyruvate--protein phosphotransferase [Caballeronia]|jgi:phosphocarrier protein FPr/phosphocarrier protein|uniref:phosphoenolpyruvate--protein phosphotransferase n=3 Tax=Caballeronia TaxID=1827195 RepID=A0A656QNE2_9BURK|nr:MULTISPECIES: phosphoenolpyruvate--protein phosphotransferase [Caballeronia]KDR32310.1 PTS mannose transporter subunit IIC [Caballeronia zhejiangensis]MDR5791643.1 phosphoenolpyruvate--protein phosphotransferase [Caballeronia sp. LP003]MDR5796084.1 phosphoenolpyruvate--protein phosphotransferase [Caballeronia sp. LZ008]
MKAPQRLARIELIAPLSGVMVQLDTVPDPVFAQKMVGDGVSIDPTSDELLAPLSGTVTQLHRAAHAATITGESGLQVLIHIGLDTVMLRGEGFTPLVKEGDTVTTGQPLIRFDPVVVGARAVSLLTQMVIANGELVTRYVPATGLVTAGKDVALTVEFVGAAADDASGGPAGAIRSDEITLPNPQGLHARPAAVFAAEAKKYKSDIRVLRGDDSANAKSVVALMALATSFGDKLRVEAAGPDAGEAAAALARLLASGSGEKPGDAPAPAVAAAEPVAPARAPSTNANEFTGVSASPGLAVGKIVQFRREVIDVAEAGESPQRERARLDAAHHEARQQIEALKANLTDPSKAQILDAHLELLDDPDLTDAAIAGISDGKSAGFAWRAAFETQASNLERVDNALLRERAGDIRDVGRRVLALLAGVKQAHIDVADESILIAEELSPSDTASLDRSKVLGFCTTTGGATSHVAILARSLGIPAICGIDEDALQLPDGTLVVLDGSHGSLRRNPSADDLAKARERIDRQTKKREEEKVAASKQAVTADGHRVEVVANIRNAQEARDAVAAGAEGVGLLRSEFLFDNRDTAPSEDEQAAEYCAVAEALGRERPLVVRTLDVGGDKPLSYLPLPKEDNPFLGLRGVRVSLDRPDMFRTQLRAILRAAPIGNLHIMFPMVASIEEVRAAKRLLQEEAGDRIDSVKVGVMIEVPSAALIAEPLAREVDFFSIGTNDLTQYTVAMDRGHPKLAKQADALHPAVLRLIGMTVDGAHKHGKWVGVCGGIASDAMAVPVLVGLGIDELSVSVPAVGSIKAQLARLTMGEARQLAAKVITLGTAAEVRALLAPYAE